MSLAFEDAIIADDAMGVSHSFRDSPRTAQLPAATRHSSPCAPRIGAMAHPINANGGIRAGTSGRLRTWHA